VESESDLIHAVADAAFVIAVEKMAENKPQS
jgi:hypothetical protein